MSDKKVTPKRSVFCKQMISPSKFSPKQKTLADSAPKKSLNLNSGYNSSKNLNNNQFQTVLDPSLYNKFSLLQNQLSGSLSQMNFNRLNSLNSINSNSDITNLNSNQNSNQNLTSPSSINFSNIFNMYNINPQLMMQLNFPLVRKVLFKKHTSIRYNRRSSITNGNNDVDLNYIKSFNNGKKRKKKKENVIEDLLHQRSLLGLSLNATKDPQSILIVNKKISKLNFKIQDLLNENSKKMLQDFWGFADSEENRKITEKPSSTSRYEINKQTNNNGYIEKNKSNKRNDDYNLENPKFKYFCLLRDDFLEDEEIINMNDEIREIYNKNKKSDKIDKLQNQIKLNLLKKMINAKTFINKKENDSQDNNQILFIRKKDMRKNVYEPCLNHKTNYESLIKKSLRPKGFKKVKSNILADEKLAQTILGNAKNSNKFENDTFLRERSFFH